MIIEKIRLPKISTSWETISSDIIFLINNTIRPKTAKTTASQTFAFVKVIKGVLKPNNFAQSPLNALLSPVNIRCRARRAFRSFVRSEDSRALLLLSGATRLRRSKQLWLFFSLTKTKIFEIDKISSHIAPIKEFINLFILRYLWEGCCVFS